MGLDFGASLMDEVLKALNMSDTQHQQRLSDDIDINNAAADEDEDVSDDDTVSGGSDGASSSSSTSTQTDNQHLGTDDLDHGDNTSHVHSTSYITGQSQLPADVNITHQQSTGQSQQPAAVNITHQQSTGQSQQPADVNITHQQSTGQSQQPATNIVSFSSASAI